MFLFCLFELFVCLLFSFIRIVCWFGLILGWFSECGWELCPDVVQKCYSYVVADYRDGVGVVLMMCWLCFCFRLMVLTANGPSR